MGGAIAASLGLLYKAAALGASRMELGPGRIDLDAGAVLVELQREVAPGVGRKRHGLAAHQLGQNAGDIAADRGRRSINDGSLVPHGWFRSMLARRGRGRDGQEMVYKSRMKRLLLALAIAVAPFAAEAQPAASGPPAVGVVRAERAADHPDRRVYRPHSGGGAGGARRARHRFSRKAAVRRGLRGQEGRPPLRPRTAALSGAGRLQQGECRPARSAAPQCAADAWSGRNTC